MPRCLSTASAIFQARNFPVLPANTVTCIGLCLDGDLEAIRLAARPYVHETEYLRSQKFLHPMDATRHWVGRALVRGMLERQIGAEARSAAFSLNAWGKPGLPGSDLEFSIAHSGKWVWAAFSRAAAVGIDIEEMLPVPDLNDLAGALHPEETKAIRQLPGDQARAAFYRCWTRKEAVLKAVGEGLSRPLDGFLVSTGMLSGGWLVEITDDDPNQWTCVDVAIPGAESQTVAVAVRAPGVSVMSQVLLVDNTVAATLSEAFQAA